MAVMERIPMHIDYDQDFVAKNHTFFVLACQSLRVELDRRIPAHRLVVEPIVRKATDMRIYGLCETNKFTAEAKTIGVQKRGFVEIDLSNEVVRGHEALWNTGAWHRGAIVIAAELADGDFKEIFRWCDGPGTWSSMAEIKKGTPASAISRAKAIAATGLVALSFTASNGLEVMDVFPPPHDSIRIVELARKSCRPFKRFVEHNPGADEIIVDRRPYLDMI